MEEYTDHLREIIQQLLVYLELPFELKSNYDGERLRLDLYGDELGALIGYHGQALNSLQLLLNLIVYKQYPEAPRVVIDVNDYRREREVFLEKLAQRAADRVRFLQTQIVLSPMSSFERYVIHKALAEDASVTTESTGEGSSRRVVVKPVQ